MLCVLSINEENLFLHRCGVMHGWSFITPAQTGSVETGGINSTKEQR